MRLKKRIDNLKSFCVVVLCVLWMAGDAQAYVDPGTTGMLTQLLYVLFYGMLGVFLYCLRYIKRIIAGGRSYLARLLTGKRDD